MGSPSTIVAAALQRLVAVVVVLVVTHVHAIAAVGPQARSDPAPAESAMDRSIEDRVLALDPANISPTDVRDVLSHAPAPRIIILNGSVALMTMEPFAEYLIAMGYPESLLKAAARCLSQTSYADSESSRARWRGITRPRA